MTPYSLPAKRDHHSPEKRQRQRRSGALALDLFCGAGGVSRGLQRAGFRVWGIDSKEQPRYAGDRFIQDDALGMMREEGFLSSFDFIWASPPCKAHTRLNSIRGGGDQGYADLIPLVREYLISSGKPYCIENVGGSTLKSCAITLCGEMFGLQTYRHRLFETSFQIRAPRHPRHKARNAPMSKSPLPGEYMHVVGHFADLPAARRAMGIDWMSREEISQAIPPAYSQYIGEYFLRNHYGTSAEDRAGDSSDQDQLSA